MRRVVLHIGLQKTGTSSIQVMLAGSEAYLASQDVSFPKLPTANQGASRVWISPFRHNIVAATYADYNSAFETLSLTQRSHFWDALKAGQQTVILSAEDFSRQKDFSILAAPLSEFDLDVVLYVRRQDLFIESLYNQRNKILVQRGDPSFLNETFLTEPDVFTFLHQQSYVPVLNFSKKLATIQAQLAPKNIHVRVFDRTVLKGGDVCADFADLLGLDMGQMFQPRHEANGSIANTELAKLKQIFLDQGEEAARAEMARINANWQAGKDLSGSYKMFSAPTRQEIRRQYQDINAELYERFGVDIR